jgi:hypothetical protein
MTAQSIELRKHERDVTDRLGISVPWLPACKSTVSSYVLLERTDYQIGLDSTSHQIV